MDYRINKEIGLKSKEYRELLLTGTMAVSVIYLMFKTNVMFAYVVLLIFIITLIWEGVNEVFKKN